MLGKEHNGGKDFIHTDKQVERCIVGHKASQSLFLCSTTLRMLICGYITCKNLISSLGKADYAAKITGGLFTVTGQEVIPQL